MAPKTAKLDSLAKLISKTAASADKKFAALTDDISGIRTEIGDLKTEMQEQFEHVDEQFRAVEGRFRDLSAELAAIRRVVDRLEDQGASTAGFAKEIDLALARIAAIENHLGIKKNHCLTITGRAAQQSRNLSAHCSIFVSSPASKTCELPSKIRELFACSPLPRLHVAHG